MSLRVRLVLVCCGLSGLIIVIFGLITYNIHGHALYDAVDRMLVAALDRAEELHNLPSPSAAGAAISLSPLLFPG